MKRTEKNKAFTIVELLTVMAVIALLIGLLVPALAMVRDRARDMQQRAQFHSISTGLEMFQADFGDYPESLDNLAPTTDPPVAPLVADAAHYGGAQKLAEAMVGWDLLGVHPRTGFRSDGENYFPSPFNDYAFIYDTINGVQAGDVYFEQDREANIDARKGPYLELENANAFQMQDVYGTNTGGFDPENFVLTDVYSRSRPSGRKTGMPVLYFRANQRYRFQDFADDGEGRVIYNFHDNYELLALGAATTANEPHRITDGTFAEQYERFEDTILNQQVLSTSNIRRPYRAGSFILWSAGKDGIFGTASDIFNFVKDE